VVRFGVVVVVRVFVIRRKTTHNVKQLRSETTN